MDPQRPNAVKNLFDDELDIRIDHCQKEQAADNTCRPIFAPVITKGSVFRPFAISSREHHINNLPASVLDLFHAFIPISLVEGWAKYTNEAPIPGPQAPPPKRSRKLQWTETSTDELFLWLAMMIYIGIHKENRLEDHWKASTPGVQRPTHPILKYMPYERFQQLLRRIRIFPPSSPAEDSPHTNFTRVKEWSTHIQRMSLYFYIPGTSIAVDECMIRFTGRSKATVTIPTKPTPTGFKVWVVAQRGYFLQWIWHDPMTRFGPVAGPPTRKRKRDPDDAPYLNPTQSVVIALTNMLPKQTYHVYLDNLFTSIDLLIALRQRDIGGTGTCRTNSGVFKGHVIAKAEDTKGLCWDWGTLKAVPSPDGLVRPFLTDLLGKQALICSLYL